MSDCPINKLLNVFIHAHTQYVHKPFWRNIIRVQLVHNRSELLHFNALQLNLNIVYLLCVLLQTNSFFFLAEIMPPVIFVEKLSATTTTISFLSLCLPPQSATCMAIFVLEDFHYIQTQICEIPHQ